MSADYIDIDRKTAITRIRKALRVRSGKPWSVCGGRGTAWGWIDVDVPPARMANRDAERAELAQLLGLSYPQRVSIAASSDYRQEYLDRAEGRTPSKIAKPYWD